MALAEFAWWSGAFRTLLVAGHRKGHPDIPMEHTFGDGRTAPEFHPLIRRLHEFQYRDFEAITDQEDT